MSKVKKIPLYMLTLCLALFACIGAYGKLEVQAGEADWTVSSDDEFVIEDGVLQKYTGSAEVLVIPDGVTAVREWGLSTTNGANIKKIIIPDSLEVLGRASFSGFNNLEIVEMGSGLKEVHYQAFNGCSNAKLIYNKPMNNVVSYSEYSLQSIKTIEFGASYSGDPSKAITGSASPNLEEVIISDENTNYFYEDGGVYSRDGEDYTLEGYLPSDATANFIIKEGVTKIKSYAITPRLYKNPITAVLPSTLQSAEKYAIYGRSNGVFSGEGNNNSINIDVSKCTNYDFNYIHFAYFGEIYADSLDGCVLKNYRTDPNWPDHKTVTEYGMIPVVVTATTLEGKEFTPYIYSEGEGITNSVVQVYDENNKLITNAACMNFKGDNCLRLFLPNPEKYAGKTVYVKYDDGMKYGMTTVPVQLDEKANAETVSIHVGQNHKVFFSYPEAKLNKTAVLVDDEYHFMGEIYTYPEELNYEFNLDQGDWKLIFIDSDKIDIYPYEGINFKDYLDECGLVKNKDYLEYDIHMERENIDLGEITVPEITSMLKYFTNNTGLTIQKDYAGNGLYYYVTFDYERTAARLLNPDDGNDLDTLDFVLKVPNGYKPVIYHTTISSLGGICYEWADNDRSERVSRIHHDMSDNNIYFWDTPIYNGSANYTDRIYMKVAVTDVIEGKLKVYWEYDGDEYLLDSVTLTRDMLAAKAPRYAKEQGAIIKGSSTPNSTVGIYRQKVGGAEELVGTAKANSAGYFTFNDVVPEGAKTGDVYNYDVVSYDAGGNIKERVNAGKTKFQFDIPFIDSMTCETLGKSYSFDFSSPKGPVISYTPYNVMTFNVSLDDDSKIEKLFLVNGGDKYEFTKLDESWVFQSYNNRPNDHMDLVAQMNVGGEIKEVFIEEIVASFILDPSGQAYEAAKENYVEGATATIYYMDSSAGKEVLWDATDYYQINPIITDKQGNYAWDVPEGSWKIRLEKEGYTPAESEWMTVPPIRTGVNLELKSIHEAQIKGIELGNDKITVTFDKYVYLDSINKDAFALKGTNGDITITEIVPVESKYRNKKVITTRVSLKVDGSLKDGEPELGYEANVKPGFTTTYADVVSTKECSFTGLKVTGVVDKISASKMFIAVHGQYYKYEVDLEGEDSFEGRVISAEVEDDSVAEIVGVTKVDENNKAYVVIKGNKLGETKIKISVDGCPVDITKDVYVLTDAKLVNKVASNNNMWDVKAIEKSDFPEFYKDADKEDKKDDIKDGTEDDTKDDKKEDLKNPDSSKDDKVDDKKDVTTNPSNNNPSTTTIAVPKVGSTVKVGKAKYVIGKKNTVAYKCSTSKTVASVTIPASIKIKGETYKVTAIAANAFKNNKKLKKISIGKNVKSIGASAFSGCKNLKTITIKTTALSSKSVGKNAFAKINTDAKVKVPKSKLKTYKNVLKAKGLKGKKQEVRIG